MRLLQRLPVAALALLAIMRGPESEAARMPERSGSPAGAAAKSSTVAWQPWSEDAFARAKREKRFILLDLEAVWCHWCHVMDETTYRDARVAAVIDRHYIALKVDQDARPDLSRRYDEYGWPATVVFAADGTEIVKRRGYIPPDRMVRLLDAIVTDPSPIKYLDQASIQSYSETPLLAEPVRKELRQRFVRSHDFELGGMEQEQKFMDRDTIEYALSIGQKGDTQAQRVARQDLDGARNLIDPVWGGAYQYSTNGDWKHPHFEKLLSIQADYLRTYALAYMLLGDPAYLKAAVDIHRYTIAFLSGPEGAFYVSQDADLVKGEHSGRYFLLDDAGRRRLGIPAIDLHLYAREQGWMVQALVQLYSATLDPLYLRQAVAAADWSMRNRSLSGGGFRHDENDAGGPYLEDSLAMGRGLLALYSVTGDRAWLTRAEQTGRFVRSTFASKTTAGYATTAERSQVLKPMPQIDENLAAARFFNLLARYTGNADYREDAERAMRYLVTRDVALLRRTEPGILITDMELASDPVHLTIVGRKDDPTAQTLFDSALRYPSGYRRIEWWDRREGPLANTDVQYPELPKAAAFVCTSGACSLPQFDGQQLLALARTLESIGQEIK